MLFEKDKPKKKSLKRWKYHELMMEMQLSSEDYEQVHKAFQGGFTHANAFYVGKNLIALQVMTLQAHTRLHSLRKNTQLLHQRE